MTQDAVRTYARGDMVDRADYAGEPNTTGVCSAEIYGVPGYDGGGRCTMAAGHGGPQHVAAYGSGAGVCGVAPRDASGDEPKRYAAGDMAGLPMRASEQGVPYCGESADPTGSYYTCSLPKGHDGPQHLTIDGASGRVVAAKDVPEPIVEQPTPEVVAERLRIASEELARTREELLAERRAHEGLQTDHDEFRQRVVDTAMELARRHDWCSVVQQGLTDMGLGDLLTRTYRVQVTVTATRTAYVDVEARESGDAWRLVDNMSASELSDAIDNSPSGSSYRFFAAGEWEHESHDSSTDVDEV